VSIRKSANILGIKYRAVPVKPNRRINEGLLGDLSSAALVLTAGTTSSGAIDPLFAGQNARWRHIDAAWAGPLRLTNTHRHLLDGIEQADSVSISAHKLLFQPKESAVVLFRSFSNVSEALSFGGPYLVKPNVGLLGSHGAAGVPLLAMLLAWGREGLASRLDSCMKAADDLTALLAEDSKYQIFSAPITGVVLWRPRSLPFEEAKRLLEGISISTAVIDGEVWFRCVASNPMVSARTYFDSIHSRLRHI